MKCIAIDDEPMALEILSSFCQRYGNIELTTFNNPISGMDRVRKMKPDLLFLDIEMPGMNGIYVGNELKKANKNVLIFVVTSYSEYLDEAMRFHVFRYLSKPIDRQRLFRNLKDALDLYHSTLLAAVMGISNCTITMLL